MTDYKCNSCSLTFDEGYLEDGSRCPNCHQSEGVVQACPNDHPDCDHDFSAKIAFCPVCGHEMCPECGCHDVIAISRVTGYNSPTSSWNAGKRQELVDRTRYDV